MKEQVNNFIYRTRLIECLLSEQANLSLLLLDIKRAEEAEERLHNVWLALDAVEWGDLEEFKKRYERYNTVYNDVIATQRNVLVNIHYWVEKSKAYTLFKKGLTGEEMELWEEVLTQAFRERERRELINKIISIEKLTDEDKERIQERLSEKEN